MLFYIKTYGCQMNERDSESAAALLSASGFTQTSDESEADIFLLNTCSVRDQAERKAIGKLGNLGRLRREKPNTVFGIMGCMAQSRGPELLKTIPHLDFVIGTDQIHALPETVQAVLAGKRKLERTGRNNPDTPEIDSHRMKNGTPRFSAFLSIMRGCNRHCSYCIVPSVRGPERSRKMEDILEEAKILADTGVREIMLLGQNVAAYGLGVIPPPPPDDLSPFAVLLEKLSGIDGLKRIRFTSPHPAFFNRRLIHAVAELPKVCKCIHLPLQSGSDRILKLMNRPYDAEHYRKITESLKELVPEIAFSTDVIVGFPTETEEDFLRTRELMEEVAFDNAFIFKYSPRKGTRSAEMEDDVPQETKEQRNAILLKDLEIRQEKRNALLSGRTFEVLVEGPSKRNPKRFSGRTDHFKTVLFEPEPGVKPGDFVSVEITRTTPMSLYGQIVHPGED